MEHNIFRDTPVSRCRYYCEHCGLAAFLDPPWQGRIVVRASEQLGAIRMPTWLGVVVRAQLRRRGIELGPVVAHARRWTYLVGADIDENDMALHARLKRFDTEVLPPGATVVLPSPTSHPGAVRRWVQPPRGDFRPYGSVVVKAITACACAGVGRG